MRSVLAHTTQQQILPLGRLGWTLSRIQQTTGPSVNGRNRAGGWSRVFSSLCGTRTRPSTEAAGQGIPRRVPIAPR